MRRLPGTRVPRRPSAADVRVGAAAAYLVASALFVYGVADRSVGWGSDAANIAIAVAACALHLVTGVGIGRWWAVALPLVTVAIAVPAGDPRIIVDPPRPVWADLAMVWLPVGALLVAAGVAVRTLVVGSEERGPASAGPRDRSRNESATR